MNATYHFWLYSGCLQAFLPQDLVNHLLQIIFPKEPTFKYSYNPGQILHKGTRWGLTIHNNQIFCLDKTLDGDTILINLSSPNQDKITLQPDESENLEISDIAITDNQEIIAADPANQAIYFFNFKSGREIKKYQSANGEPFSYPRRIAISRFDGRIAISSGPRGVFVFDRNFNFIFSFISEPGGSPWGIGFQSNGNIVVADDDGTTRIHDGTSGAELINKFSSYGFNFFFLFFFIFYNFF
jgi:DNA-binding beta-propeller fold protein YncE